MRMNKTFEAMISDAIPVAESAKYMAFALATPTIPNWALPTPFPDPCAVIVIAAGPGENTTTKVVIANKMNVLSSMIFSLTEGT